MKSKLTFIGVIVLGALIGGTLGIIDTSGVFIGVISGMFIAALIYGIVMLQFLRKEQSSPYEDQERQASEKMWGQKANSPLSQVRKAARMEEWRERTKYR